MGILCFQSTSYHSSLHLLGHPNLCFTDSPSVLRIDSGHDWTQLNASQVLWGPNDESGSVYIAINGRLRALIDQDNKEVSIAGEYGQGCNTGELGVITNSQSWRTVHAIHDTELARVCAHDVDPLQRYLYAHHSQSTVQLLRHIALTHYFSCAK